MHAQREAIEVVLSECAKKLSGDEGKALKAAVEEVEDQQDEHLYSGMKKARRPRGPGPSRVG